MTTRRKISKAIQKQVIQRAEHRCSYCRSPSWAGVPMVMEHIIPLVAGGNSSLDNLCLACYRCNEFKGAKREGTDPFSNLKVMLFHPQQQIWTEHFTWSDNKLEIIGLTPCGRATVNVLKLNNSQLITARQIWIIAGLHPPL